MLLRKGVYPYEYINDWNKFNDTKLPSRDAFYSSQKETNITKQDYKHAKKVRYAFECKNMGDYYHLYVQLDTLLLADYFENFRTLCLKEYELDPCYFVSTPGFAFESCLKKTGVKIESLRDIDMILMIEKGIRGGITQAIHRYASANNKYMSNYKSNYPSTFLTYLDG